MRTLKYTGPADSQSFRKEDFDRHGIEDQGAVTFNERNDFTNEVSDGAAEYLLSKENGWADRFEAVGEDAEAATEGGDSGSDGSEEPTGDAGAGDATGAADADAVASVGDGDTPTVSGASAPTTSTTGGRRGRAGGTSGT